MMLTSVPPALIHRVRDAAAWVHDLAQLGLDLLCPCEEGHGARLRVLEGDGTGTALPLALEGSTDVRLGCRCGWRQSVPQSLGWWADMVLEQHQAQCPLEGAA